MPESPDRRPARAAGAKPASGARTSKPAAGKTWPGKSAAASSRSARPAAGKTSTGGKPPAGKTWSARPATGKAFERTPADRGTSATPRAGAPRAGAPRAGAPRAGAPRAGSARPPQSRAAAPWRESADGAQPRASARPASRGASYGRSPDRTPDRTPGRAPVERGAPPRAGRPASSRPAARPTDSSTRRPTGNSSARPSSASSSARPARSEPRDAAPVRAAAERPSGPPARTGPRGLERAAYQERSSARGKAAAAPRAGSARPPAARDGQAPAYRGARPDQKGTPYRGRPSEQSGPAARVERGVRRPATIDPPVPDDVLPAELPREARAELRTVSKETADLVARHLVMAGRLIEDDPKSAYAHAEAARRRLPRIAVVREAVGLCAYANGDWAEALAELRASRRINGAVDHLPVMADCERGLGRPERALALAASPEARGLDRAGTVEMRIVASGARRDLGQPEAAVVSLQGADLDPQRRDPWSARLFYAYADALLAARRRDDARQWFVAAALADAEGDTDAQDRIDELDAG
jgi:hypothetical protein